MRVVIAGGKLQGLEAAYLAEKAGWEVVLVDKNPLVPAAGISKEQYCLDITEGTELISVLKNADLLVPALENNRVLRSLSKQAKAAGIPMIYDANAYRISSSKTISNNFFKHIDVPAPAQWPACGFPLIAKPSEASGSEGVTKIFSQREFSYFKARNPQWQNWILEEYLEGPSYSIEVIGFQGKYELFQITELQMDKHYDCKRVLAPAGIDNTLSRAFEEIAITIASNLNLNGIMDVEVILNQGALKVLEIDARLPSQTPTAVLHSTGINILKRLGEYHVHGRRPAILQARETRGVIFEHLRVSPETIEVSGEHVIAQAGPLQIYEGLFGADEVITDYFPGKKSWVATLIVTGTERQQAWKKRQEVIGMIKEETKAKYCFDTFPVQTPENIFNYGS